MGVAQRVSGLNRQRKWRQFLEVVKPSPGLRILDVGYTEREHQDADNFLEKHYPYPESITALGVDEPHEFRKRYPAVRAVCYDGIQFPFADQSFDVAWSNAVIEHVGGPQDQVRFLREIARVSRLAFVTTPNRYFPLEVHTRLPFVHWLPKPVFDRILVGMGRAWAAGDYMDLLGRGDFRRRLAAAGIGRYGFIENRLAGLTLDFVAVIGSLHEPEQAATLSTSAN